jgi:hypothetical protein
MLLVELGNGKGNDGACVRTKTCTHRAPRRALWSIKGIANHRYLIQRWLTFHGIHLTINDVGHFEGVLRFLMVLAFTSGVMK